MDITSTISLGVDTSTTWAVCVPMFLWWSLACATASARLEKRHWGISLGAVRAHVARIEIAHAAALAGARSHDLPSSNEERVAAFIYKAMICCGSLLAVPIAPGASSWQRRRMALIVGEIFAQLQPCIVLMVWGATMLTVRGGLRFGLMLLTVGQATTVLLWLLGKWRSVGWSQPGLVLASAWAARAGPVATVALVLWSSCLLALTPYGSITTAWIFFSAQLSIICLERVDKYAADQSLTVKLFAVAKAPSDSESTDVDGSNPEEGRNSAEAIPRPQQPLEVPPTALDFMKRTLSEVSLRRLQALAVLLVYVMWVAVAAPQGGKRVGAANAAAVLVVDATFAILARCPNAVFAPGSFAVLFLEAAARAIIAGGGSSQWFLSHCVVFVLLAGFVVRYSIKTRGLVWEIAHVDDESEMDADHAALRASEALRLGPSKAARSRSDVTHDSSRPTSLPAWTIYAKKWRLKNSDLLVLLSLVTALIVEMAVVAAHSGGSSSGSKPLEVGTLAIPQWSLGVLALGLVLAGAAVEATIEAERLDARVRRVSVHQVLWMVENAGERSAEDTVVGGANVDVDEGSQAAYHSSSPKLSSSPNHGILNGGLAWQRLGAMLAALAVIGGIVHFVTGSYAILALGTCFPTAIVAARALRSQYMARHYERLWDDPYALPPRHRRNTFLALEGPTNANIAATAPATTSTSTITTTTTTIETAEDPPAALSATIASTTTVTPGLWSSGYPLFAWPFSAQQFYRNWRAGDFRPVAFPFALVRGGLSVTDYSSFAAWFALVGSLTLGWEVAAAEGWRAAFVMPLCFVEVLSVMAAFDAWHHLLSWRAPAVLGASVLALVVHVVLHVWLLALKESSADDFSSATEASISDSDLSDSSISTSTTTTSSALSTWGCIVLLSFLGWPAAALVSYAVKLLFGVHPGAATNSNQAALNGSDSSGSAQGAAAAPTRSNPSNEGWGIEASLVGVPKASLVCLAGSALLWLLFALLVGALYSWVAGSAILVMLCLTAGASSLGWVWRANRYYLPPRTRAAALGTSLALVAICCLVSAVWLSGVAAFALVSLTVWGLATGLLLTAAAEQVSASARGEHLAFSACDRSMCLPAVRYHFSNGTLRVDHRPLVWSGLGWALLMAWSFAATTLLDQPSVGLVTLASLCLVASFAGVAACTEPTKQISHAWQFLEDDAQGTLESIDPDKSLKRRPPPQGDGLFSRASPSHWNTAALQPPRFMQQLRHARTAALLATVPPPSSSTITLSASEGTPLDAMPSEVNENAAADNNAEQRWVRLATASGCILNHQASSNGSLSSGCSASNGLGPQGEAALWFSVALLHAAMDQATVKELRATVGDSCSACLSVLTSLVPRTPTTTTNVTESVATLTVDEQQQQQQDDVSDASRPGGGDPFSLIGASSTTSNSGARFSPASDDQFLWPLDSAKVNQVAAALVSRLPKDQRSRDTANKNSSSNSSNSEWRLGYKESVEVAAREVTNSGSVLWLQPVHEGWSIAGNPLTRRAALHYTSPDDVEAGSAAANGDGAPGASAAPSAAAATADNSISSEEHDSAWYAVWRLQERAEWATIQRALLLAHFHRAVIAAAAEEKDHREVRFCKFVGWLRAHVPRSELGVLALPLLGPKQSLHHNGKAAPNTGVATDGISSTTANASENSTSNGRNPLASTTSMTITSEANHGTNVNTSNTTDAPATSTGVSEDEGTFHEHRGVGLSDVLQWAAPHRTKVARLVARFTVWEAEEKAAAEAARRDAEAAALRRAAAEANEEDDDNDKLFEADYSLPEQFRSGKVEWKSASRDLGITDLCSHPESLAAQTGTSRFAPEDVCQGQLGDCWLVSAMSLVALQPELLERTFASNLEATADGNYRVQLFKQGKWRKIKIDDRLPVTAAEHRMPWDMRGPLFVRSVGNNELWPSLLEKAYAKYYGGYGEIEGGLPHLGLVDLTGGVGTKWTITPGSTSQDSLPTRQMWEKLKGGLLTKDTLVGAGSTSGRDTEATPRGIAKGHAYAILQVREIDDLQLLQLRNPWGTSAWSGPYSDKDTSSWTPRLKAALAYDPKAHRSQATGVFWISVADFVREFDSLFLCRLFRTVSQGGQWHKHSFSSRWSIAKNTAGGYRAASTAPQFLWRCARPAEVYATLTLDHDHQDDDDAAAGGGGGCSRSDGHGADEGSAPPRQDPHIALFLLEAPSGGKVCNRVTQGKVADSGNFTNSPTVSVAVPRLEVRDDGYVFLGTTYETGSESPFTVTLFADYPFTLERLN